MSYSNGKKQSYVKLNNVSDYLINAFISIEDKKFYSHHGIDLKRIGGALLKNIKNNSITEGASTITQQLVKNITGENSSKITRKVKEWFRAITLEAVLDKDEILEAYFNIIYIGPNLYGVETGSKYYFNKSSKDLTLEECAFLAGINNAPNSYNPFDTNKDN